MRTQSIVAGRRVTVHSNEVMGAPRMANRLPLVALLAYAIIAAACFAFTALPRSALAQATLQPATLRLDWLASGYHVPFFLALERGYYREHGIDLQIADGKGSTTTIQVVASGSDTFGAANLS